MSEEQNQCSICNLISFQLFVIIALSFSTYETNLLMSGYSIYNMVAIIHGIYPGINIAITLLDHKDVCVGDTLLEVSHEVGNKQSFKGV